MSVATDLTIVRNYCSRTDKQTLTLADALVRLSDAGQSVRDIVTAVADTAMPLGRNRIAIIVKVRRANPNATADGFGAALRDATAANTGRVKAEPVTTDTATAAAPAATVTAAAPVAPITLDTLTDRLADLMADARAFLTGADLTAFLASVEAEVTVSVPVALPVAVAA